MNNYRTRTLTLLSVLWLISVLNLPSLAGPPLEQGTWTRISPQSVVMTAENHVFCQGMAIDPANPSTLYLCICAYEVSYGGLYKTTDGGVTWRKIGQLDEPIHIVIDPKDSRHLCCVDGVRGDTQGFWVSRDGGETWTQPSGFQAATVKPIGTRDVYSIAADPANFNHMLISFHSPWDWKAGTCGVLETKDGGTTWAAHDPPAESAHGYGMAIFFLYDPARHVGDSKTWLFTAQSGGFFRTIDGGITWQKVYDKQMTHGGCQIYRSKPGVLYAGGYQYPVRSTDNGASWQQLKTGLTYSWYIGICGDGNNLYTGCSNENEPVFTSPESDGTNWKPYTFNGTTQRFSAVPFEMAYDRKNHIMYAASWHEGLLALKIQQK